MLIYINGDNDILWSHPNDELKNDPEYIEDPKVIVVGCAFPEVPDDGNGYKLIYNDAKKIIELVKIELGFIIVSHEQLTEQTHKVVNVNKEDNLVNMELGIDTNGLVLTNTEDTLMLMELLMEVDAKLTQLLQPKV